MTTLHHLGRAVGETLGMCRMSGRTLVTGAPGVSS
jgi:hypothetical protein